LDLVEGSLELSVYKTSVRYRRFANCQTLLSALFSGPTVLSSLKRCM